jgi:hypothetical protein
MNNGVFKRFFAFKGEEKKIYIDTTKYANFRHFKTANTVYKMLDFFHFILLKTNSLMVYKNLKVSTVLRGIKRVAKMRRKEDVR